VIGRDLRKGVCGERRGRGRGEGGNKMDGGKMTEGQMNMNSMEQWVGTGDSSSSRDGASTATTTTAVLM